jgi:phosphoglycerate dehydrogenase-like enzyme
MTRMVWRFQKDLLLHRPCRVVFAGPHFQAALPLTRERLLNHPYAHHKIEIVHAPTQQELYQVAPLADVAIPFMERLDATFIQSASQLRLIVQFGVGLEGVQVDEATRHGIAVSNIPAHDTGNAQTTAEHALFLAISLLRQSSDELPRRFQQGQLGGVPAPRSLYKKRVTVVGYGSVGSTLCHYLTTMGASVTAVRRKWMNDNCDDDSNNNNNNNNAILRSTSLKEVLPTTDVLILACTMTPETYLLMNHETLSLLPHGALVVNVGRGPLVDYSAILKGLESGAIGGFASDVGVGGHPTKPSEPWDPDDPLSQHARTLFTPHVGGYTEYSYGIMADKVLGAIDNVIHGKPPTVWVNQPSDETTND